MSHRTIWQSEDNRTIVDTYDLPQPDGTTKGVCVRVYGTQHYASSLSVKGFGQLATAIADALDMPVMLGPEQLGELILTRLASPPPPGGDDGD